MCQLFLHKSNVESSIKSVVIAQMLTNTAFRNTDGAGLYSVPNGIIKTELSFKDCMWGNAFINPFDTVIGHVRAATASSTGKKEICFNNSHPFYIEGLVLAHNGSLEYKKGYKGNVEVLPEEVDSKIFLKELAYTMKTIKTVPEALKTTMENFTGKFAFLLHNKSDNAFYAIRGRTAPLHKCVFTVDKEPFSLIVNTEETSLKNNLVFYTALYQVLLGKSVDCTVTEIKQETINIVKGYDLEEVGTIKENTAEIKTTAVQFTSRELYDDDDYYWDYANSAYMERFIDRDVNSWKKTPSGSYVKVEESILKDPFLLQKGIEKLVELQVSYKDFDMFSHAVLKKPPCSLNREELINLCAFVIRLTETYDKEYPSTTIQKEQLIQKCMQVSKEKLQFPFYLNEIETLVELLEKEGISDIY